MVTANKHPQFQLRIPEELKQNLKSKAEERGVTLTTEMVDRLQETLQIDEYLQSKGVTTENRPATHRDTKVFLATGVGATPVDLPPWDLPTADQAKSLANEARLGEKTKLMSEIAESIQSKARDGEMHALIRVEDWHEGLTLEIANQLIASGYTAAIVRKTGWFENEGGKTLVISWGDDPEPSIFQNDDPELSIFQNDDQPDLRDGFSITAKFVED